MRELLFILFFIPTLCQAQFKATPNGFIAEDGNKFVVFNIEGRNATEIYKSVEAWCLSTFKNPDIAISRQQDKLLNIHGFFYRAFTSKGLLGGRYALNVDVNLIIHFKDEKIKIDIPIINKMYSPYSSYDVATGKNIDKECFFTFSRKYYEQYSIQSEISKEQPFFLFKKDGTPYKSYIDFIKNLNGFINSTIYCIVNYAKQQADNNW